ncbi:hypothetical protein F5146DRAFT_536241 [Armillaria mellea]|nr:hypothetical protein F5146DRAFT_536241 [Armillaria mellea]
MDTGHRYCVANWCSVLIMGSTLHEMIPVAERSGGVLKRMVHMHADGRFTLHVCDAISVAGQYARSVGTVRFLRDHVYRIRSFPLVRSHYCDYHECCLVLSPGPSDTIPTPVSMRFCSLTVIYSSPCRVSAKSNKLRSIEIIVLPLLLPPFFLLPLMLGECGRGVRLLSRLQKRLGTGRLVR